jgi:hypothetical protein
MNANKDRMLHKHYLADIRCDVSQHSGWRGRVFDNKENSKFTITPESIEDVFRILARDIKTHHLEFIVEKILAEQMAVKLSDPTDIVFQFYPKNYPELIKYSFNNPMAL